MRKEINQRLNMCNPFKIKGVKYLKLPGVNLSESTWIFPQFPTPYYRLLFSSSLHFYPGQKLHFSPQIWVILPKI